MKLYTTKPVNVTKLRTSEHTRYLRRAYALGVEYDRDRTCPKSGSGHHYYTQRVCLFGLLPWTLACRCGKWLR